MILSKYKDIYEYVYTSPAIPFVFEKVKIREKDEMIILKSIEYISSWLLMLNKTNNVIIMYEINVIKSGNLFFMLLIFKNSHNDIIESA